jgi:Flp pilus assembly protein TadB
MAGRGGWSRRRLAVCVVVGLVVAVVTRWPVAALLSALAAWTLPVIIGPDRDHARRVARIEAIATWTEMIRDNLAGAAGLEQAITASAIEAPEAIRDDVQRLALRLQRGWPLTRALRELAGELADPTGDAIVRGLLQAARGSAAQLGEVLSELAAAGRAKVASRQRVAASRKRNRTSARVIVAATLAMAVLLALIDRTFLRPFDTATGQLVLLVGVGGCFAAAFWGMARLMRDRDTARFLAAVAQPEADTTEGVTR